MDRSTCFRGSPEPAAARLFVCPLSKLEATLTASGAETVLTLLRRGGSPVPGMASRRHIRLEFSDIAEPRDGHTMPGADHVGELLNFASAWDRSAPALIHCYAGVSRSTAAAFVVACALQPHIDENVLARSLRTASPTATPNPLIVALADERLGRAGRMTTAIAAIGRGAECFEGVPFHLEIDSRGKIDARSGISAAHPRASGDPDATG